MYYLCSENKGADELRGYREADLRLCFRIYKTPFFSRRGSYNSKHYDNTPIQYTTIFTAVKFDNFQLKSFDNFLIFAQNSRLWVQVRTASVRRFLRVTTLYVLEHKKENNVYPCKPQFYYIKVGCKGYTLHGHVSMMNWGLQWYICIIFSYLFY